MLDEILAIDLNEDNQEMGSLNHSYIQANLAWLLKNLKQYSVFTELSLDINHLDLNDCEINLKNEIKPDVCIYPKMSIDCSHDIIKMSQTPLLAIEILSPTQAIQTLQQKIDVYFKLGVKSCWLIYPSAKTIAVYSDQHSFQAFSHEKIMDDVLNIEFNLTDIFS